jgi:hypothetical protein
MAKYRVELVTYHNVGISHDVEVEARDKDEAEERAEMIVEDCISGEDFDFEHTPEDNGLWDELSNYGFSSPDKVRITKTKRIKR